MWPCCSTKEYRDLFGRYLHENGIKHRVERNSFVVGGQHGCREVNIFEGERSSTITVYKEVCGDAVFTITKVDGPINSRGRFLCLYLIIKVLVIYYV